MADDLTTTVDELFSRERSHLLRRVVRVVELDKDVPFIQALERVHTAAEGAVNTGDGTLGGMLHWLGEDAEASGQTLKLLEQRDEMVQRVYDKAAAPIMLDTEVDERGLVKTLDQPSADVAAPGRDSDPAVILAGDPVVIERRLARARKADPGQWSGDTGDGPANGRARFREQDRAHATQGLDLVRSLELPGELAAARAVADSVGEKLDAAIARTADKQQRLRALDAQLAELGQKRETVATEPGGTSIKLLDVAEPTGTTEPAIDTTGRVVQKVRERMRELDRPDSDFLMTLHEILGTRS